MDTKNFYEPLLCFDFENLINDDANYNEYLAKSNNQIIDQIYSSYDLALNEKYKVRVFQNTLERIKNNFK